MQVDTKKIHLVPKPGRKDEPLTLYGQKERMTLAKTKEQEPTAVKKRIWKPC